MKIEYKIKRFCNLLLSLNWEQIQDKNSSQTLIRMVNNKLYEKPIDICLYINYKSPDFSRQTLLTIKKSIQIDERIIDKPETKDLIIFLKNYERHNSKLKRNWIIPEPNSKYTEIEIPTLYIPQILYL